MLAVFGYLWFMMAPVQEILNIQYAFYAAKAALFRINRLNGLKQEPHYPHLKIRSEQKNRPLFGSIICTSVMVKKKY